MLKSSTFELGYILCWITKLEIHNAVMMKIPVFCTVKRCSLLDRYQCLRQTHCHFNLVDMGRMYISFKCWYLPMFAVYHILQDTNLQEEVNLPSNWKTIQNLNFFLQSRLIQICPS